ncbi:MAG: hypothetical protein ACXVQU_09885 [Actinomycetota bacterium]
MRTRGRTHLARSFVTILGATLVVTGAGLAAARTMSGPPWQQPLLTAPCDTGGSTTDTTAGTDPALGTITDGTTVTDTTAVTDTTTTDCTTTTDTTGTTDPAQQAADAQAFFDTFGSQCGTAVVGDTALTDASTDPQTVQAYSSLVDALNSGQIDHMVQSVRVLLQNCEAHANDGLRNALYHHGLNWQRHYQHELWLEQKFADKWPDGKPGGGADAGTKTHGNPHETDTTDTTDTTNAGGSTTTHGNPHDSDPSWSPGASSNGNGNGHTK